MNVIFNARKNVMYFLPCVMASWYDRYFQIIIGFLFFTVLIDNIGVYKDGQG